MPTVFLDVVFKPFFKIVHNTGQLLTIDRTNFLADGFHQLIQRTGCVSVNTRFQITPKEKNHTLKDRESEGATACLRNGKWGARETFFEQWSLTRLQCALWHHLVVESGQPRGKECRPLRPPLPPSAYLLSTTHSKYVRFPWVTLYYQISNFMKIRPVGHELLRANSRTEEWTDRHTGMTKLTFAFVILRTRHKRLKEVE